MTTIITPDELLHRALRWISDERRERPGRGTMRLVEEAALRFDLSPAAEDWLLRTLSAPDGTAAPDAGPDHGKTG